MKNIRFLTFVLTIGTLVLSACGAAATPTPAPTLSVGSDKVEAMPVAFIGTVDSMAGDQWVIGGTTVTVDPTVVRDGPFSVGDQVKVEGVINPDGSFTVSRVEVPTPQDVSTLPQFGNDNSNAANANDNVNDANVNEDNSNANFNDNGTNTNDDNGNGANVNDDNGNGGNTNDDNGGGNSNDDNGNDDSGGGGGNSGKGGGGDDNSGSGKGGGNDDNGGGSGGGGGDD